MQQFSPKGVTYEMIGLERKSIEKYVENMR